MINSELLKEAIADAKAVRATALANAKASLEEAFAPRFEAMFAEKLKEESEEEGMVSEVEAPNQVSGKGGEAKGPATKAVSKGNPKKVSDASTNWKVVAVGGAESAKQSSAPKMTPSVVKETAEEEEGCKMDESNFTSEDLDEIIAELEQEVSGEEEGQPLPAPAPVAPEGEVGGEVPQLPPAPPVEGEPDGDEVGAAPAPVAPPIEGDPTGGEVPQAPPVEGDPTAGGLPQAPQVPAGEEEINLEELLASLNEESEEEEKEVSEGKLPPWLKKKGEKGEKEEKGEDKEEVDENTKGYSSGDAQNKSGGVKGYPAAPQDASKKQLTGKNHNISGKGNIGTGAVGGLSEASKYKVALKESYDAIRFLRGQINEVNLLNAKLLYTNKLFKEFAVVLDDSYRMKIVESFDLTKSVREVKLAYALLAESLNFGRNINSAKPAAKVPAKRVVNQITEGLASRSVASTKPVQIINEVSEMALRFKKLAGIPNAPKK